MDLGPNAPIAVWLWHTVQRMTRAFDELLAEHGGSRPVWHILLALQSNTHATQRDLAAEVGIREATLTHHLRAMEERGLIIRYRAASNRRVQQIEVTPDGVALFKELRKEAMAFDRQLRKVLGSEADVATFRDALDRIATALDDGRPVPPLG
ncbi:MarR family winged helix-turn-helix transcriptional regulator [Georgenia halophila]|uniref:MarR family winged helix-turn-helix transcriptional regulator n=1 Tax=Georgenia halophila TaxID=620889 RepID=A0ABP8LCZ3_9MICO